MKLPDLPDEYTAPIAIGSAMLAAFVVFKFVKRQAGKAASAINPTNNNNVIARGVNDAGAAITGDEGFSIGGLFYDYSASRRRREHSEQLGLTEPQADRIQEWFFGDWPQDVADVRRVMRHLNIGA